MLFHLFEIYCNFVTHCLLGRREQLPDLLQRMGHITLCFFNCLIVFFEFRISELILNLLADIF